MNFKQVNNQYRIKFKGDVRVMILPTPFSIEIEGNRILLDYRISTLFNGDKELINTLKKVKKTNKSNFYDKVAEIIIDE